MKYGKYISIITSLLAVLCINTSCGNFLDQESDSILTDDQVFNDEVLIKSVLANYYGRMETASSWGQRTNSVVSMTYLDEAAYTDGGPNSRNSFASDLWRLYDYTFVRNLNQFLAGVRNTTALDKSTQLQLEGETRFMRAWYYFTMARGLGGMPIVGDEVYTYDSSTDVTSMQLARSTEVEIYDYIISECTAIADYLPTTATTHAARANKWAALMLKARAALYAGSLANYNNKMASPITTSGGEVGIPASKASEYYNTALTAAKEVLNSGVYTLMTNSSDPGLAFYNALNVKDNNTEVIWALDYYYPGKTVGFTRLNIPASHAEDVDNSTASPILNLVEAFEYKDNRDGHLKIEDENGNYIFYDNPQDPFLNKDGRLWGTVIYPGAEFKSIAVELQAGQLVPDGSGWKTVTSANLGDKDDNGLLITSANGPAANNNQYVNKTGFYFRKFMDETPSAATRGRNSDLWFPYFRIAEAYMIACEASFELGQNDEAAKYISIIRNRAGLGDLTTVTLDDIVNENRVEFAFEDHRWWDMKRWRLADKVWNGVYDDENAQQWALFPYKVNAPGNANDGKWVFIKQRVNTEPYPRHFQLENYYNFINTTWIDNNPKIVKNPYQ